MESFLFPSSFFGWIKTCLTAAVHLRPEGSKSVNLPPKTQISKTSAGWTLTDMWRSVFWTDRIALIWILIWVDDWWEMWCISKDARLYNLCQITQHYNFPIRQVCRILRPESAVQTRSRISQISQPSGSSPVSDSLHRPSAKVEVTAADAQIYNTWSIWAQWSWRS